MARGNLLADYLRRVSSVSESQLWERKNLNTLSTRDVKTCQSTSRQLSECSTFVRWCFCSFSHELILGANKSLFYWGQSIAIYCRIDIFSHPWTVPDELLGLKSMHGTTTGKEILQMFTAAFPDAQLAEELCLVDLEPSGPSLSQKTSPEAKFMQLLRTFTAEVGSPPLTGCLM